jgi:hypothetical protein
VVGTDSLLEERRRFKGQCKVKDLREEQDLTLCRSNLDA